MPDLPRTQTRLDAQAHQPRKADPGAITHRHRPEAELPLPRGHPLRYLRKGIHIHGPAQQTLPEHNAKDNIHGREEVEGEGLRHEEGEVGAL